MPRPVASDRGGHDASYAFDAQQPDGSYVEGTRSAFLSTLQPGPSQWRFAWAVVLVSLLLFLALAPFAKLTMPQMPAFLPAYQSALVVVDAITMVLLVGQYAILRSRALLVLACAYLFSALMAVAHALSFPGLFSPTGLFGGGQTTAWLYFIWHAGFPASVMAYALLKGRAASPESSGRQVPIAVAAGVLLTVGAVVLATAIAQWAGLALPLMVGSADGQPKAMVATLTWMVGLATLALLWVRRPHSVIDLWLMVVLCVWTADTALASVLNQGRYDLGWYAGRIYGLLASSFVLAVLLLENSMLYARLVEANEAQRRRAHELRRVTTELEAANRDLDAFAGGLAHDLQQPIMTISAFARVIQKQSGHLMGAGETSHLQRIIAAAGLAHSMVRGLLDFARLGQKPIALVPVDLDHVISQARNSLDGDAATARVAWEVGAMPAVRGDASLLLLAFVNLLSNAAKYCREAAQPLVRVEGWRAPDGTIHIRIRDNGVGFDMAQAARLFRPFERLHHASAFEGTGMGLANARRIMERHGGTITVEASPGAGASFTLVFPAGD